MPGVFVLRVLSEDPWRAKQVEKKEASTVDKAMELMDKKVAELEEKGYECSEYGSASIMLCIKSRDGVIEDKLVVGLVIENFDELLGDDINVV